jgi:adenine-specific DNA glycosylase
LLSPKAKPLHVSRQALVVTQGTQVLLMQRSLEGTFGGMWEPPNLEGQEREEEAARGLEALREALGVRRGVAMESLGSVVHVLSHRRMNVSVYAAHKSVGTREPRLPSDEYVAWKWVAVAELDQVPLTTFARKVLRKARVG